MRKCACGHAGSKHEDTNVGLLSALFALVGSMAGVACKVKGCACTEYRPQYTAPEEADMAAASLKFLSGTG